MIPETNRSSTNTSLGSTGIACRRRNQDVFCEDEKPCTARVAFPKLILNRAQNAFPPNDPDVAVLSALSGPFSNLTRSVFRIDIDTGVVLDTAKPLTPSRCNCCSHLQPRRLDSLRLRWQASLYDHPTDGFRIADWQSRFESDQPGIPPQRQQLYGAKVSALFTIDPGSAQVTQVATWPAFSLNPEGIAFVGE